MAVAGQSTTLEDREYWPSASDDRPDLSRAVGWSVAAVVIVECLYALWTASRGFFWQDDFIDLHALRQLGFGGRLLEQPVFGHFIPGFTLVDYLVSLQAPYQWWSIVLAEVALFGLSLFLLHRLLVTLFGPTWLGVALVALAGASFSLVPSLVWWATALEYLVAIPATLLACIFQVRYLRSGQLRDAVLGSVALAVGFVFYDGLFVSVLFIVLMTVLFWPVAPGLHGVTRTLAAHRRAWVCYGVPVALEVGWRFAHPGLYITGGSASPGQTFGFIGLSWSQTFVPLVFGVDPWVLPAHVERILAGLVGQILFVAFVVWTLLKRTSAWRAWALIGTTFLMSATLVGVTRAGTYGPGDASDVKYVALDTFLLMIAAGFAVLPVRPLTTGLPAATARAEFAGNRSHRPRRGARPAWFRPVLAATVAAVVLVYGMALVFDQDRDSESAGSQGSHRFFAAFATSWATNASSTSRAFLWDTEINPSIVTRKFFPYDTASVTIGPLHPDIRFDEWGGTGFLLRSEGSVVRAAAVTQARGLVNARTACADTHDRPGKIAVTLDHRLNGARRWFGLVSYESPTGAVATQPDGTTVRFPKGTGTLITAFPPAPLAAASWSVPPRERLCVTGLRVVLPEPVGSPSS
jgi:hypothetical protein